MCSFITFQNTAIITISFERESYAALEGSSRPLEVCIHTTDRIKSEQRLTVNVDITADAVGASSQGTVCVCVCVYVCVCVRVRACVCMYVCLSIIASPVSFAPPPFVGS